MIDVIAKDCLVFILMITVSVLIIVRIVNSRRRVMENYNFSENLTFRKDVRLAITSIMLNMFYILLIFPVNLVTFDIIKVNYDVIIFFYYLCLCSYGINFYLMLATNSLVRGKFFSLFKKEPNNSRQ